MRTRLVTSGRFVAGKILREHTAAAERTVESQSERACAAKDSDEAWRVAYMQFDIGLREAPTTNLYRRNRPKFAYRNR
jgi:hypothetical protein